MTGETSVTPRTSYFTSAEKRALRALRARYRQDADLFSDRERAHLHFLRWFYRTGRFGETACSQAG
jgi:hypothetical protein